MNPVDMKKVYPTLNQAQQFFVKKIEKENVTRAMNVKTMRRKNAKWGIGLGLFALSTCILFSLTQRWRSRLEVISNNCL